MWSRCLKLRLRLNRTWKVSIIYKLTWLVKTLHNMLSFLHFLLFSSCPLSFYCTLTSSLSLSQCRQPSAAFSTRLCKTRTLQRTSRVVLPVLDCQEAPFFPVLHRWAWLGILAHQVSPWVSASDAIISVHLHARKRKLTDTDVRTLRE